MTGPSERSRASRILHIHSGDSTAEAARAANIAGDHVPFREALVDGPAAAQLRPDFRALLRNGHDRIICWFDRDLFCRVNFWFVVTQIPRESDLYLAESHDPDRLDEPPRRLTDRDRNDAVQAWNAYSSDDPRRAESISRSDSQSAQPLRLHLSRYPSTRNGLGVVEERILSLISATPMAALDVVHCFISMSQDLGFGDTQIWSTMKRLAAGMSPLISLSADDIQTAQVAITLTGQDVLAGRADAVRVNGIDLWLGGVHLRGTDSPWRWDGMKLVSRRGFSS